MKLRKNDGFTLVELMVTILVSTMVTAVAATTILYGLYINKQSAYIQSQQSATRILITALEDMASEGAIKEVLSNDESWEVRDTDNKVLMQYKDGVISGPGGNNPIMKNILSSSVYRTSQNVLYVEVETEEGKFGTSVNCRMGIAHAEESERADLAPEILEDEAEKDLNSLADTQENRTDFLNLLVKERDSKGWITLSNPLTYYSQWYIETAEGDEGRKKWENGDWNPSTAWCACYISWALNQQKNTLYIPQVTFKNESGSEETLTWINEDSKEPYWFADVDKFMAYFQLLHDEKLVEEEGAPQYWVSMRNQPNARPNPGDIIFFDTDLRDTDETTNHVGVVFHVDKKLDASGIDLNPNDDVIYTIEGNSLGKVAIRQYSATNKTILGYGVLPWIPNLSELIVGTWQNKEGKTITFSDDKSGICFTENMNIPDCDWVFNTDTNSYAVTARNIASTATIQIINHNDNLYLIMDGNYEKPFALVP